MTEDNIKGPWTVDGETIWLLDTDSGNTSYTVYNREGKPVAVVAVDHSFDQDEILEEIAGLVVAAPNLLTACKLQMKAWDELFGHCLSNGIYNAWGKAFDCTELNRAKSALDAAIYQAENGV